MREHFQSSALLEDAIAKLRDKNTDSSLFRYYLRKVGTYLSYEAAKHIETTSISISTPVAYTEVPIIQEKIVILSLLRAAMPMSEAVLNQFEQASYGVISASRAEMIGDEGRAFKISGGYNNIPSVEGKTVIIVDPMLATGSTIKYLLDHITKQQVKQIFLLIAISSDFGLNLIEKAYPQVKIFSATVDQELNSKGYIVPGLGDAGDRVCNTPH
ncbi:MAG: uracil phosphoribosyltransferase [Candidatus Heimdallarchaeota archaeon]|nr:uracil phosphoribosyltransferase [Candidatus Heimdallarchaeota archaeon]